MSDPSVLQGAVIGCGFFANNHLHAWKEVRGAEIVAVCDIDADKAHRAAKTFGIAKRYTDAEAMLQTEQLDFVDIITTMDSHRLLVELAARHTVPAIVQKPFAPTLEDAQAMVDACHHANAPLMVHENFRWQTPLLAVREVIDSGTIGTPFFGRVSFRHGNPVGFENQPYLFEQKQYIINDVGIHLLDLARFFFGEVSRIYTEIQRVNPRFKGEDVATIILRHQQGATCIADLSVSTQAEPDPFPQTLVRVEATQGTVEVMQDYQLCITRGEKQETRSVAPRIYPWAEEPWALVQDSVVNIQQHWVDCLHTGADPATSGMDNLKSLALTFAAYDSADQGVPITLKG